MKEVTSTLVKMRMDRIWTNCIEFERPYFQSFFSILTTHIHLVGNRNNILSSKIFERFWFVYSRLYFKPGIPADRKKRIGHQGSKSGAQNFNNSLNLKWYTYSRCQRYNSTPRWLKYYILWGSVHKLCQKHKEINWKFSRVLHDLHCIWIKYFARSICRLNCFWNDCSWNYRSASPSMKITGFTSSAAIQYWPYYFIALC